MHSREGVTQGDPLATIAYSIGILPLIKNLKRELHDVTQTRYVDNDRELGTFARIDTYFHSLTQQGLGRVCYPKPSKSVLIVHPDNLKARKWFSTHHGFKMCTGASYLGDYIEEDDSKRDWLRERT